MTAEEVKFSLYVENVFNNIRQPEYRQLVVETLIILTMLADSAHINYIHEYIDVCYLLHNANELFVRKEASLLIGLSTLWRPQCGFRFIYVFQLLVFQLRKVLMASFSSCYISLAARRLNLLQPTDVCF